LHRFGIGEDTYAAFWISLAAALLGGWLLHVIVERPFLRLRDRLLRRDAASAQKKVVAPL
jgi:peptidoglycan/LPS O-acetylase OafA/YrhL